MAVQYLSLQRYVYYIEHGVPEEMLANPPDRLWEALRKGVPKDLIKNWSHLAESLFAEINHDYRIAVKKAIGESYWKPAIFIFYNGNYHDLLLFFQWIIYY